MLCGGGRPEPIDPARMRLPVPGPPPSGAKKMPKTLVHSPPAFPQRNSSTPAAAWAGAIERWIEWSRQRRALRRLNDHLLRDIGLTQEEADRETEKPFWRA